MATDLRLDALVLAAGFGKRFGGGKLMALFEGRPLVAHAIEAAKAAPVRGVTVVTGADPRVAPVAEQAGARTVLAEDYASGLSASLRAGLEGLPGDSDGVFVFLGDMPRVPATVLRAMADALAAGAAAAQPVHKGRRGNPALIGAALYPQLRTLSGDAGAGKLLASLGGEVALVEADEGVLFDVDTPIEGVERDPHA